MAVSKVILNNTTLIDVTQKTVTAGSMLSGTTALKNDGTDISGNIASKTSANLSVSGATVTAPAGYYASDASTSVASGSATTPATTITTNPSISVSSGGLITASVSGSKSVTPAVSAGYVSSGTAGTVSVSGSNTNQLTAKAAATYYPSTSDQNISASQYLTGAQTIKAVEYSDTLIAPNIAEGVTVTIGDADDDDRILSVTGTMRSGGNLAKKTVSPSESVQYIFPYDYSGSRNFTGIGIKAHPAGDTITSYGNTITPSYTFIDGDTYHISGTVSAIGSSSADVLETYDIDADVEWSTTWSNVFEGDASAYFSSVRVQKNGTTSFNIMYICQTVGTYGVNATLRFYHHNGYDGLSEVVVEAVPSSFMSPTTLRNYLTRSSQFNGSNFVWPDLMTTIGAFAFANCSSFNISSLPDGVITIGDYAFYQCSAFNPTSLPSGIRQLGQYTFYNCSNLAISSLPSGITSISSYTFYGCTKLALTALPNGITSIGQWSFASCSSMTLTSLPSSLTTLGNSSFQYCTGLALTSIPNGVTTIPQNAFNGCTSLALTSLSNNLTSIQQSAFTGCTNIALTTLPSTLTSIGQNAFAGCEKLISISCDGAITSMQAYAFGGLANHPMLLQSAFFPNLAQTSQLSYVFGHPNTASYACQLLETVDLGNVGGIGSYAFMNCNSLTTLILRKTGSVCTLGTTAAFSNTPFGGYNGLTGTVYVPSALISSYKTATNWSTLYNNGTCNFLAIEGSAWDLS